MANKDYPRGMWPLNEGGAARPRCRTYPVAASTTIYQGSPVILQADGTVAATSTTGDQTNLLGAAAHYVSTGVGETSTVAVFDDPNQLFMIQDDGTGTLAQTSVGLNAPFAASPGAGNSNTRVSTAELSGTNAATTSALPLRILGKVERINNEWGDNVDLIVQINTGQHIYNDDAGI